MVDPISALIGPDGEKWSASAEDLKRQAIAALRGYVYQLHQTLAAWIALPDDATLHLEISEDYAEIVRDPEIIETILEATQLKDTRESGSVTLNSADVLDAIRNFWALRSSNPGKKVRLVFLTTSPIGREQKPPLADGGKGLEAWAEAARGASVAPMRAALKHRFPDHGTLTAFLDQSDDETLRRELLAPMRWICGALPIEAIEADNRAALVVLGQKMKGTPDLSARAADSLLAFLISTILGSKDRRLRRGDLMTKLWDAITVRVPSQLAFAGPELVARGLDLEATGAWRIAALPSGPYAPREAAIGALREVMGLGAVAWLHGATGLGKSILAELAGVAWGGEWRVLDLRGAEAAVASERLVAARLAMLANPEIAGLILDDLSPALERDIEAPLGELAASLARRGLPLIVTSNQPPGQRLLRALALGEPGVVLMPSFEKEDAAALVAAYGGDAAKWGWFALVAGAGHPQLVDTVIAGLVRRNWPDSAMRDWMTAGLKNDDVESEREAVRRRLLSELTPSTFGLLARAARIFGSFDRALVVAAGAVEPPLAAPGIALDQLAGLWIERQGGGRLRLSPLVQGLDREVLDEAALKALDLAITVNIMTRKPIDADLFDTAFFHAWLAREEKWVNAIVQFVMARTDEERPIFASIMPTFRGASGDLGFLGGRPMVLILLRLAQHLLLTSIGTAEQVAESARALVQSLDELLSENVEMADSGSIIVLMKMLNDGYAFGLIPDWFLHLRRFAQLVRAKDKISALMDRVTAGADTDPVGFIMLAHAARLPGVAALGALFDELDGLPAEERDYWLGALHVELMAIGMVVDNAWMREIEAGPVDGRAHAASFARMAEMALRWNEKRLAGRCYRAQALMLDEYAGDIQAAYAALDAAETRLPGNFDTARERGKIAWRSDDHALALEVLRGLEDKVDQTDALDAAFCLREAAMSAGELGQLAESARLYSEAERYALVARDGAPWPMSVGLAEDRVAALFGDGQRAVAVREMVEILSGIDRIDPLTKLTAHAVHLFARHIVLWMRAHDAALLVDELPIRYPPGAASNPGPKAEMASMPIAPIGPVWMMLTRVALDAGITLEEVLAWSGLTSARADPIVDAMVRMELLTYAVGAGSLSLVARFLVPAVEATVYFGALHAAGTLPDARQVSTGSIPALSRDALGGAFVRDQIRDAALAFQFLALEQGDATLVSNRALRDAVIEAVGYDALPEWAPQPVFDDEQTRSLVARYLPDLQSGAPLPPEQLFLVHLRILEWGRMSSFRDEVAKALEAFVRRSWLEVAEKQRALLVMPAVHVPFISDALAAELHPEAYVARLLLAVEPAISLNLAPQYRTLLGEIAASAAPAKPIAGYGRPDSSAP